MDRLSGEGWKRSTRRGSAWPAYLLIILIPLEAYSASLFGDVQLTPAFAFMMAFLPMFLLHLAFGQVRLLNSPVTGLFFLYSFISLATVAMTDDPRASFVAWGAGGLMILAYLYISAYVDTSAKLETAITCFIVIGVVAAIMGLVQFFGYVLFLKYILPPFVPEGVTVGGALGFAGGLMRMGGFFGAANKLGSFLLIPLGLALYMATRPNGPRAMYRCCGAVLCTAIILSLSRNGHLALLVFLVALALLGPRTYSVRIVRVFAVVLLVSFMLYQTSPFFREAFIDRMNPFGESETIASVVSAPALFLSHAGASLIAGSANLGLGRGLLNYDDWAMSMGLVTEWGAHSNFLHFFGETGIIGFSIQLLVVLFLVSLTLRHLHVTRGQDRLALYLIGIYLGMVVAGIVRTYYYTEYVWVLIALILRNVQLHSRRVFHLAPGMAPDLHGGWAGQRA